MSTSASATERRGIPAASFVEDVQTYLSQLNLDVNSALAFLQERLQQYRVVEMKLLAQQRDLQHLFLAMGNLTIIFLLIKQQAKIPDIECLDVVATLQAKKGTGEEDSVTPMLQPLESIPLKFPRRQLLLILKFLKAFTPELVLKMDSVCLWLGANVMLEYSCEEATVLLQKNLENAKASLEVLVADLQFLRDQVTITQVTIARVYNWDVHQRRLRQAVAATSES
ncbi:hypothetical protein DH2020_043678 [Rehmannia glutinosa]|uniref:Prefoldin subunit 3 n=1 Tax=Rehmannia glutinosa TaxID=99300 RepID=A0ABR0UJW5_REHGL